MKVQKIQKNDEKRRFMRSKVKVQKIRKNDEKRLSGGGEVQNKKIRKNDEKRRLAYLGPFYNFGFETTIQLSVENFFFIDAFAHSPISAHSFISLMTEK